MKYFLAIALFLTTACGTISKVPASSVIVRENITPSKTHGQVVRRDFVGFSRRASLCPDREEAGKYIYLPGEFPLESGKLIMVAGSVNCKDKSRAYDEATVTKFNVYNSVWGYSGTESKKALGSRKEEVGYETVNNEDVKYPKEGEIIFVVGDKEERVKFTNEFYGNDAKFLITMPNNLKEKIDSEVAKNSKELINFSIRYKDTVSLLQVNANNFNHKCPSPVEGEPDAEKHCPDYAPPQEELEAENREAERLEAEKEAKRKAEVEKERTPAFIKKELCSLYNGYVKAYEDIIAREKEVGRRTGVINAQAVSQAGNGILATEQLYLNPGKKEYERKSGKKFNRSECK